MHSTIFSSVKLTTYTMHYRESSWEWQPFVRRADSQLSTSYFGYAKEICCEDISKIMWPRSTSSICSKNMLSHHPIYTNLDYKHVPQEWCDVICFESCCIKTASQVTRYSLLTSINADPLNVSWNVASHRDQSLALFYTYYIPLLLLTLLSVTT